MPIFTVRKTIRIDAPVEKVHAIVRDFRQWQPWSPWLLAEPSCKVTHSADGRSYAWDGVIVGSGEMAVTSEDAPRSIDYRLSFFKPWKSVNTTGFQFVAKDGGTEVTWSMEGSLPVLLFWMKGMMSAFVGMDYERGLKMLKDYVESGEVPSKLAFEGSKTGSGCRYIGVRASCAMSEIGPCMEKGFGRLTEYLGASGVEPAGAPLAVYHKWVMAKGLAEFTCGLPVKEIPADLPEDLVSGAIPAGRTYAIRHTGPYRHLGNAWSAGEMHARAKPRIFRRDRKIDPYEVYENDPDQVPEKEVATVVHFPERED